MPLQAHKYNTRAPHCCKQRTTTLAPTYRDPEPATLNINTCCYTVHPGTPISDQSRRHLQRSGWKRNQKTQTRGENVDKKTLVPDGDAGATGGANQHKWREEDEADPPRRCSFAPLVSSRRMREKGKETTCSEV